MPRFLKCILSLALILMFILPAVSENEAAAGKDIIIVNRTGASIAEFYFTNESNAKWGALKNKAWIKADEEIVLSFTADELAQVWKARIGVSRAGKVTYYTFNNIDLAPMAETGYASFMPKEEGSTAVIFEATKKEFFYLSNTTDFTISEVFLMPSGTVSNQANRLEKPLLPGELVQIRMSYEELLQETNWNLRLGIDEGDSTTYFTLQNFPIEKLTGCECVVLKPYKDSMSFYYSKDPIEF